MRLNNTELGIMKFLWLNAAPASRGEVINGVENRTWKPETFHMLINKLLAKGAVKVDGYISDNERHGRTYSPTITQDEYAQAQLESISTPVTGLFAAWIDDDNVDISELEQFKKHIQNRINELKNHD